jgi:ABC-type glycerol-3-phosphate transport system substrate-binding protein
MKIGFVSFVFVCVAAMAGFLACGGRSGPASYGEPVELTFMLGNGDGKYWLDIGSLELTADDFTTYNPAAVYAVAKAYKAIYPNVKINLYTTAGDVEDMDQERENFRMDHGVYPDMYVSSDLSGDAQKGLIADLSVFKDDPMYKNFHPSLMAMGNLYGRQFGIPVYALPWAVYVNKSLAESLNIDVPDPDWTIDEFNRFVSRSKANEFYGTMGEWTDIKLIGSGTRDLEYMLRNRNPGEPFVNINSEPIRNLLRFADQWTAHSVWPNYELGLVSQGVMDEFWYWGYVMFVNGKLLTHTGDPWMLGFAAHPDTSQWSSVKAADWDIYPRPSTSYVGNHMGVVFQPLVIRNYAMDDGDPALSAEERSKLTVAWDFAKFWSGDTRSWEARSKQRYRDGDNYRYTVDDSLPRVTGPEFNRQMEIWFMPDEHRRFMDKSKMPGFHYVLQLWEDGQFWDVTGGSYPSQYDFEGSRRSILYEWENMTKEEVAGASRTDSNWLDQVYARLPQWNTAINQRWESEILRLEEALNRYYPK